jgi:hypothetical protein
VPVTIRSASLGASSTMAMLPAHTQV